jgi:hypothetical protein
MSRFTPLRGIGPACREAARRTRLARVAYIRARRWDRLAELRHERLDNWLYNEVKRLQAQEAP